MPCFAAGAIAVGGCVGDHTDPSHKLEDDFAFLYGNLVLQMFSARVVRGLWMAAWPV